MNNKSSIFELNTHRKYIREIVYFHPTLRTLINKPMLTKEEDSVIQRIMLLIKEKDLSVRGLAIAIDMPPSTIGGYFHEDPAKRREPGVDLVRRILSKFSDISPDWLLFGKGAMFRDKPHGEWEQIKQDVQSLIPLIGQVDFLTKQNISTQSQLTEIELALRKVENKGKKSNGG